MKKITMGVGITLVLTRIMQRTSFKDLMLMAAESDNDPRAKARLEELAQIPVYEAIQKMVTRLDIATLSDILSVISLTREEYDCILHSDSIKHSLFLAAVFFIGEGIITLLDGTKIYLPHEIAKLSTTHSDIMLQHIKTITGKTVNADSLDMLSFLKDQHGLIAGQYLTKDAPAEFKQLLIPAWSEEMHSLRPQYLKDQVVAVYTLRAVEGNVWSVLPREITRLIVVSILD